MKTGPENLAAWVTREMQRNAAAIFAPEVVQKAADAGVKAIADEVKRIVGGIEKNAVQKAKAEVEKAVNKALKKFLGR